LFFLGDLILKRIELKILNEYGLHARPASRLANIANQFKCDIRLVNDGKEINAKSVMNLLLLAAGKGSVISFIFDGEDEDLAADALKDFIEVQKLDDEDDTQ